MCDFYEYDHRIKFIKAISFLHKISTLVSRILTINYSVGRFDDVGNIKYTLYWQKKKKIKKEGNGIEAV